MPDGHVARACVMPGISRKFWFGLRFPELSPGFYGLRISDIQRVSIRVSDISWTGSILTHGVRVILSMT
eukprot:1015996-Amorphochlora_amoeboformis.AAC.1